MAYFIVTPVTTQCYKLYRRPTAKRAVGKRAPRTALPCQYSYFGFKRPVGKQAPSTEAGNPIRKLGSESENWRDKENIARIVLNCQKCKHQCLKFLGSIFEGVF